MFKIDVQIIDVQITNVQICRCANEKIADTPSSHLHIYSSAHPHIFLNKPILNKPIPR